MVFNSLFQKCHGWHFRRFSYSIHVNRVELLCNIQFSLLEKPLGKPKEAVNKESKCTLAIKNPPSSSHRLSIFNHVPFLHDVFLVPFNFSEKKPECIKSRSRNAELGINAIFIFCFISWFFYANIGKFQCFSYLAKITLLLNWFSVVIHT